MGKNPVKPEDVLLDFHVKVSYSGCK
jgi:hypothetical protein